MAEFGAAATLSLEIPDSELRDARREIEDELGDIEVSVAADAPSRRLADGGRAGGADLQALSSTIDDLEGLAQTRNDLLRELVDETESGNRLRARGGGGGGGGILGLLLGGAAGLGLGALSGLGDSLGSIDPTSNVPTEIPVAAPDEIPVDAPDSIPVSAPGAIPVVGPSAIPTVPSFPVPIPVGLPGAAGSPAPSPTPSPAGQTPPVGEIPGAPDPSPGAPAPDDSPGELPVPVPSARQAGAGAAILGAATGGAAALSRLAPFGGGVGAPTSRGVGAPALPPLLGQTPFGRRLGQRALEGAGGNRSTTRREETSVEINVDARDRESQGVVEAIQRRLDELERRLRDQERAPDTRGEL